MTELDQIDRVAIAFEPAFQPAGHPELITLGMARPFPGGVRVIGSVGQRELARGSSPWGAFAIVGVFTLVTATSLYFLGGTMLAAVVASVLVPLLLGVVLWGRRERGHALVVDARRNCCELHDGASVALTIPGAEVRRTWVQVHRSDDDDLGDVFDVLVDLGSRELWVAQLPNERGAREMALAIASGLGVRCDAAAVRKH